MGHPLICFFFLIKLGLFRDVKISTASLFHFYFSGVQESKAEVIDISKIFWLARDDVRRAFVRSGFADKRLGENRLLPCPLGTFADSSLTDSNCKKCSAGKL